MTMLNSADHSTLTKTGDKGKDFIQFWILSVEEPQNFLAGIISETVLRIKMPCNLSKVPD